MLWLSWIIAHRSGSLFAWQAEAPTPRPTEPQRTQHLTGAVRTSSGQKFF